MSHVLRRGLVREGAYNDQKVPHTKHMANRHLSACSCTPSSQLPPASHIDCLTGIVDTYRTI